MANGNNESSMNHIIFHCDINVNYDDNDDDDSTNKDTITWACAAAAPSVVSPWQSCTSSRGITVAIMYLFLQATEHSSYDDGCI